MAELKLSFEKLAGKKELKETIGSFKETHTKGKGDTKGKHIEDWKMFGLYLGYRLGAVKQPLPNGDIRVKDLLYFYDLIEHEIKIISVPQIYGKIKYAIMARKINKFDVIAAKYNGKKLNKNTNLEYNDYDVEIFDIQENKDLLEQKNKYEIDGEEKEITVKEYIDTIIDEHFWNLWQKEEENLQYIADKQSVTNEFDELNNDLQ
jgi:hypothetical protein